jgi:hypothetical protein
MHWEDEKKFLEEQLEILVELRKHLGQSVMLTLLYRFWRSGSLFARDHLNPH